ncbi:MAG: hypothetical protein AUJ08_03975 [Thaumarchaeota archaeon 13_1_40CM_3_50_5]|nr:MAG: hypothetical protein AUH37_03255 [Candidatus Nitrososphaera sp. 13_1_40CM_48_12]OLC25389.1 MAG: hypothetical protein AUH71_01130 [Thaumarchaeota archaeon 13_1_40CM_4_48_7]OLC84557.1 MAG: hypothetical protein AUJ08_03975 [Thaumarchaeota archaeon 13_1_40CM_3_50_5]TLY10816.1 MAG: DUF371 domain-containing protein [Nitrososphaerota archaeon]
MQDEVTFYGHPNVRSLHSKTVEITRDGHLTLRGDCIIGVRASKACADFDQNLRRRLRSNDSVVRIEIMVGDESFLINGKGDERFTLQNPHDIVIRKTGFVCPRTMSVRCDRASSDVPRKMVRMLQDTEERGIFRITVE